MTIFRKVYLSLLANRSCTARKHLFFLQFQCCSPVQCKNINSSSEEEAEGSSSSVLDSQDASSNWRKGQLNKITDKFDTSADSKMPEQDELMEVTSDEQVQAMWKDMESRVLRRRSILVSDAGKKVGRRNIGKTDEEVWLDAGFYDEEK